MSHKSYAGIYVDHLILNARQSDYSDDLLLILLKPQQREALR
jgi:hypothetical protein